MSESITSITKQPIVEHKFEYIFPDSTVSDVLDRLRSYKFEARDFVFITELYSDRLTPKSKREILERMDKIDGMTIGEIQKISPTIYSEFCAGYPNPTDSQISSFERELGPTVNAFEHSQHTAGLMNDWLSTNNRKSYEKYENVYEKDLLISAALFNNAAESIVGTPTGNRLLDITEKYKSRMLRELIYGAFEDNDHEAELIASTIYTGTYSDPFHQTVEQNVESHKQYLAAITLDYLNTGLRAYQSIPTRELQRSDEQVQKYRTLAYTVAKIAVPTMIILKPTYKAVRKFLDKDETKEYILSQFMQEL